MYKSKKMAGKISILITMSIIASLFVIPNVSAEAANYNYGEALQKAIMFYEFQRAGVLPDEQRNNWRGDSGLTDGAEDGVDLVGGWFDAGDHVKFNLPMAYTLTMLAWSVYESKDAYVKSGQYPFIMDNIKWASDYLIKCHPSPNVYYYQVGDGDADHKWWGPAEAMQMERPAHKVTSSSPGSTVVGEAAAALAATAIIFKNDDLAYSQTCLKHAKELFEFADSTKSDAGYTAANNFYKSWSGFYDELTWASIWIYLATNDNTYLNKAESYEPKWAREQQSTTIKYKWAHCWDDKLMGSFLLLARATDKPLYKECIERHLDYWTVGTGSNRIKYTPKGLAWLDTWGSLRYATTEAFLASVYSDWSGADKTKAVAYDSFAKSQIDYALGSTGRSFVVGYGTNPPKRPHHRTAHSSWSDQQTNPSYHRHVLYGALVGGPSASDSYVDAIDDYTANEVACDYNAGFVGILAKMYGEYGGNPIPDFKAIEEKTNEEFFVEARINGQGPNYIEIKSFTNNRSGWPSRVGDKLSYRYFMDLTEAVKAGFNISDIKVSTNYNQGGKASELIPYDEAKNIYYVEVDFTGTKIYPGGQSDYKKEVQLRISGPIDSKFWDSTNDFSYKDISEAGETPVITKYIPLYDDGVRIFGYEPNDMTDPSPSSSTKPTQKPTNTPVPSNSQSPKTTPTSGTGNSIKGFVEVSGAKVEIEGTAYSSSTNEQGYFEIKNVPASNSVGYNLNISKPGYLTRIISNIVLTNKDISISSSSSSISLICGDINNDGSINIGDVIELAKSFNSTKSDANYNNLADLNNDGSINMSDVLIIATSFGKTSSDYPTVKIQ